MSIYANIQASKDMDIHRSYAISKRMGYLTDRLLYLDELISGWIDYFLKSADDINEEFCYDNVCRHLDERDKLNREVETIKRMTQDRESDITDQMIEQARRVSVSSLIDFKNRKATAFCHSDQNPSLVYLDRTGRAWCPVCDKHFDAIGVLMERDGMIFKDAVKSLCSR